MARPPHTQRRERERQQRLDAILDAAIAEFADRGIEAASMAAIAGRAELSKAALYYYFPDKQALHAAAAVVIVRRFFDELAATAPPRGDLAMVVGELLAFYVRRFSEDRGLLRVMDEYMAHGRVRPTEGPGAEMMSAHAPWMRRLETLLADSVWAADPRGFQAFLFDVTVCLKNLCLAGRDDEAQARVGFYTDLVRRAARPGETP